MTMTHRESNLDPFPPGASWSQVENISAILNQYPHALIAGAPFPDYLYSCGSDHGAGKALFACPARTLGGMGVAGCLLFDTWWLES